MLFSIITVTRNNAAGLRVTYDSITRQTCRDFEWLVIDGASTDNTRQLLQSSRTAISTLISEPDHGIYDAMNKGLAQARGDYLLFLNAGDALAAPEVLAKLQTTLKQQTVDFIYGDSYEAQPNGDILFKPARPVWLKFWGMFAHHQAMLYRRAALKDLRYNLRFGVAADYALTLAVLKTQATCWRVRFAIAGCAVPGLSTTAASQGRREQLLIRYGQLPSLLNVGIYLLQGALWQLKCRLPFIYRRLRFRAARR